MSFWIIWITVTDKSIIAFLFLFFFYLLTLFLSFTLLQLAIKQSIFLETNTSCASLSHLLFGKTSEYQFFYCLQVLTLMNASEPFPELSTFSHFSNLISDLMLILNILHTYQETMIFTVLSGIFCFILIYYQTTCPSCRKWNWKMLLV